jgi:hypothetical protein
MAQLPSVGLSCPGCARRDFWSLFDVRDHFKKEHHSLQCSVCQRYFKDELSIIQHYQKYNNPALPGTLNDIRWAIPPSISLSSAAVAQSPQSGAFQTDAPEDTWEPPSQAPDYLHVPMIHSFHGTTPVMDGGKRPSLGKGS